MMLKRVGLIGGIGLIAVLLYLSTLWFNPYGEHQPPGEAHPAPLPVERVFAKQSAQAQTIAEVSPTHSARNEQILFGDLHVHSTLSSDAFFLNLPLLGGSGAHPPADACDFARHCAALDFWSINDHAESITPLRWLETKETIRQCNAIAGDPANPDLVSFLGWEWTQVGATPETHYGHKNVIFRDTAEEDVPARPIAALGENFKSFRSADLSVGRLALPLIDFANRQRYFDLDVFFKEMAAVPDCESGIDVRGLPADCVEAVETPRELFDKLDDWGFDALVIPHGATWGATTPRGASWSKDLRLDQHDPEREILLELYSGHGNSEEYRDWRHVAWDAEGNAYCPTPTKQFKAECWRAGEIILSRCLATISESSGETQSSESSPTTPVECHARAARTRQLHVDAGQRGPLVVPGQQLSDWLDSGQCNDCFTPAPGYRPGRSAQYALALRDFSNPEAPRRYRFGLMASSDNHSGRPGTGYKETAREGMSDNRGIANRSLGQLLPAEPRTAEPRVVRPSDPAAANAAERSAPFMLTGGLVAVHANGRDRDSIWRALKRREVYGTSGPRILLWFDLLNPPDADTQSLPMGSDVNMQGKPLFRVSAAGSFEQHPGCAETTRQMLGSDRIEALCLGECYHPSNERRPIDRIEIIRIQPQAFAGEPIAGRIEDPWRVFPCENDVTGCSVEFSDPDFTSDARDTVYYARAIEVPSPVVNAGGLRCARDETGECLQIDPCLGGWQNPKEDDCTTTAQQRAWSSPIFVDFGEI